MSFVSFQRGGPHIFEMGALEKDGAQKVLKFVEVEVTSSRKIRLLILEIRLTGM